MLEINTEMESQHSYNSVCFGLKPKEMQPFPKQNLYINLTEAEIMDKVEDLKVTLKVGK